MGKLIFYLLIAVLIYWLIKCRRFKQTTNRPVDEIGEDMVRCAYCGVYLPESGAVNHHGKYFCTHEHYHSYRKSSS